MTHCVNKLSNQEVKRHCRRCRLFRLMFRSLYSTQRPLKSLVLSHRNKSTMSTGANGDLCSNRSIHSDNIEEVHNVPMDVITRPFPSVLDELKVQSLMKTIKVICVSFIFIRLCKFILLRHLIHHPAVFPSRPTWRRTAAAAASPTILHLSRLFKPYSFHNAS